MKRARLAGLALVAPLLLAGLAAAKEAPKPSHDRAGALAASLAERLAGKTVRLPGGGEVAVLGPPGALLSAERVATCVETLFEADGWPSSWLVIQDAGRPFDVVIHVVLGEDGNVTEPDVMFAAPRGEWDADAVEAAVKTATGKKAPRERTRSVVVQSFTTKVVTTYVYEPSKAGKEKGTLSSLLPEGAILRDARSVDLGDGYRHTLAIALIGATFVPSECSSCADRIFGHADAAAKVLLVLAGEKGLEDTLDLTAHLRGTGGGPLLPRFPCVEGDATGAASARGYEDRFGKREPARLVELEDLNADGHRLEIALPAEFIDCDKHTSVVAGVDPQTRTLHVLFERIDRDSAR